MTPPENDVETIESRLRSEMGRLPATPDRAVLTVIRARARRERTIGERFREAVRPGVPRPGRRLSFAAAMAGLTAVALWALDRTVSPGPNGGGVRGVDPAAGLGADQPFTPSWWLILAITLGVVAGIVTLHRLFNRPALTIGLTVAAGAALFLAVTTVPYVRIGSQLAADPPPLDGFIADRIDRPWLPPTDGSRLVRITFRAADSATELPETGSDGYRALTRNLGFTELTADPAVRCRTTARDDTYDATTWCTVGIVGNALVVDGTVFDTDALALGREVAVVAMLVGLALAGAAAVGRWVAGMSPGKAFGATWALVAIGFATALLAW